MDAEGRSLEVDHVVDGQQRLTTVVLLMGALRSELSSYEGNEALCEGIRKSFLWVERCKPPARSSLSPTTTATSAMPRAADSTTCTARPHASKTRRVSSKQKTEPQCSEGRDATIGFKWRLLGWGAGVRARHGDVDRFEVPDPVVVGEAYAPGKLVFARLARWVLGRCSNHLAECAVGWIGFHSARWRRDRSVCNRKRNARFGCALAARVGSAATGPRRRSRSRPSADARGLARPCPCHRGGDRARTEPRATVARGQVT